jgi:hypothetical protein
MATDFAHVNLTGLLGACHVPAEQNYGPLALVAHRHSSADNAAHFRKYASRGVKSLEIKLLM